MNEEQRIKLEELIGDYEVAIIQTTSPVARGLAEEAKTKAHKRITDHLDTIQGGATDNA